jgi:hypothetical protein
MHVGCLWFHTHMTASGAGIVEAYMHHEDNVV